MDDKNTNPKQALIQRLQESTNILVTVRNNPNVDQLAACIGLTLWLNKGGKHATAVFSGDVPSTLEFLQPEATIEKTTDSLRDFIISLDKSKADKLRYKVEDKVVKIFITPYHTSLSGDDLDFSQGDFNVDTVIALGVGSQAELDVAITAHGRILHDATVASLTIGNTPVDLGSIAWHDSAASSLSELAYDLGKSLFADEVDGQIATALLTGVVAETERFSNDKTTPQTMSVSAALMSAGANQQLVASKLEEPAAIPAVDEAVFEEAPVAVSSDGTLEIEHTADEVAADDIKLPEVSDDVAISDELPADDGDVTNEYVAAPTDEHPFTSVIAEGAQKTVDNTSQASLATDAPKVEESSVDDSPPILHHSEVAPEPIEPDLVETTPVEPAPVADATPVEQPPAGPVMHDDRPSWMPAQPWMEEAAAAEQPAIEANVGEPNQTLEDIERSVASPHVEAPTESEFVATPVEPISEPVEAAPELTPEPAAELDSARDEVERALGSVPVANPEPIQALGAQPIDLTAGSDSASPTPDLSFDPTKFDIANDPDQPTLVEPTPQPAPMPTPEPTPVPDPELTGPVDQSFTMPLPNPLAPPPANPVPPTSFNNDATAPPPVPPPLMPPGFPPAQ